MSKNNTFSKNKGQKSITVIIVKALIKLIYNIIENIKLHKIKKIYNSTLIRTTYIIITLISIFCLLYFKCFKGLLLAPFVYFLILAVWQVMVEWYYTGRYYKVYLLFDKKAKVITVSHEVDNIVYIIHSFLPVIEIQKKIGMLEQYFNTNIIEVKQDKNNKRLITITTNKLNDIYSISTMDGKLTNIFRGCGFIPELISIQEGDFETCIAYKIDTDIKTIQSKMDDISFKLNHAVTVMLDDCKYMFYIKEKETKIFNFQDYLHLARPKKNMILPTVLGLKHKDSKVLIVDMAKLIHTFINGKTGSGKSCVFNSLIQGGMYFNSSKIVWIMIDFKIVEFKQYESFKNVVYITKMEDFYNVLKDIQKEIDDRYRTFGKIKNIEDYNHVGNNIPYIMICIDECSCISLNKKYKNDTWDMLIDIVQRGRACGVIIIAATQCPDYTLVNTSFRRQIDSKIIGRLSRREDARIAGISEKVGVDKFGVGEFVLDCVGYDHVKLQGLYIDEKASKNLVFEALEDRLNYTNLLDKKGHNEGHNNNDLVNYGINIQKPCLLVINYVARFKKIIGSNENNNISDTITTNGVKENLALYIRLMFYLAEYSYTALPATTELTEKLGATEKQLRLAKEKLQKMNILEKQSKTRYKINIKNLQNEVDKITKI